MAMNRRDALGLLRFDYLMLIPIIGLAFYMAFIPHQNYSYPVHIDDWRSLAYFKATIQAASPTITDPFSGESGMNFIYLAEIGFTVFWAVFHQISGIEWLTIFRYFPSIVFIITVLSVYVLARREGFGWEAAFFACLIITTVGILGPAFLLPVAMGLLFIPLSIFLAFYFRNIWSYLVLFVFTSFLVSIHAVTAVGLIIILAPFIVLNIKGDFKHCLGLTLALGLPFVAVGLIIPFSWVDKLVPIVKGLFTPKDIPITIVLPRIIQTYGSIPILLSLLGTLLLAIKGGKKNYGLILGLLALLLMLVSYYTFHYGEAIMYGRGILYMLLMLGVAAGFGLMWLRKLRLPDKLAAKLKPDFLGKNVGNILCLVLIGLTLATCIPLRYDISYYHMIDDEDYQAFVWIRDNVSEDHDRAILDPWKATAFTAITMKKVYTRIHMAPTDKDNEAYEFLRQGCTDTSFLKENEISVIYTRGECHNPDLVEVTKHVYLLE